MPTNRGIPQSFGILITFALLTAGIFALVGFAINKGADRSVVEAKAHSEDAAVDGWETGLFCVEEGQEDDPALSETTFAPETCAAQRQFTVEELDAEAEAAAAYGGTAARGAELYVANGCQVCHGDLGEGIVGPTIAQTGLDIRGVLEQYRNPRGIMQRFWPEDVTPENVADIWTWLQSLPAVEELIDPNSDALGHENYGQWATAE